MLATSGLQSRLQGGKIQIARRVHADLDTLQATKFRSFQRPPGIKKFGYFFSAVAAAGFGRMQKLALVVPEIETDQLAVGLATRENFHGFQGSPGSNDAHGGAQHPGGVAGIHIAESRGLFDEAAQAGCTGWADRPHHAFGTDDTSVDPRRSGENGHIIDEKPGLEIVRPIADQIKAGKQFPRVPGSEIRNERSQFNFRVGPRKPCRCYIRLGLTEIIFGVKQLPLKVAAFRKVAIDQGQVPYARSCQPGCYHRSQRSEAHNGHSLGTQKSVGFWTKKSALFRIAAHGYEL